MSRHFCCCIPVRFGVFVFSLVHFLWNGFWAAIFWLSLHFAITGQTVNGVNWSQVNKAGKISLGVVGGILSLLALIAFGGWIGSIARSRPLVRLYSVTTWIIFFVYAAVSGYMLYLAYSGKNLFNGCEVNGKDCVDFQFKWWQKLLYTVGVVIGLIINIWIASTIGKYVDQLDSENDTWSRQYQPAKVAGASTYEPTYYPQQAQEVNQGLLNPAASYPYTDQAHSFGHSQA